MNKEETKFKAGDRVEVVIDVTIKGLKGTVNLACEDADGGIEYLLKDIDCPRSTDRHGKEYLPYPNSGWFQDSWLKKIS